MPLIYMIRHGKAAAGWDTHPDPGLDGRGRTQAQQAASFIQERQVVACPVLTSPLKRCRETSAPLCVAWNVEAVVEPRIAEIPSPFEDISVRGAWLGEAMNGTWAEAVSSARSHGGRPDFERTLSRWRQGVIQVLQEVRENTVIFSHFVAINVAVAHVCDEEQVLCFRPDNGSVTVFQTEGTKLALVERGAQAETKVN